MAGGLVLGAALMAGLSTCLPPASILQRLPEPMLARALMAGSASSIVTSRRYPDAIMLYARPVPINETLCRVVQYGFALQDSGGFPQAPPSVFESYAIVGAPDISTTSVLSPAAPAPAGEEFISAKAKKACSDYRDFDHLVTGSSLEIAQALLLLETARWDVIKDRAAFSVECRDEAHGGTPASCDGRAYLRDLDLKQITGVSSSSGPDQNGDAEVSYWIQVQYRIHGHPIVTDLRISTLRLHEADSRIAAITINRDAY
ncbi:hypothetical protein [Brevundimonas sp.]|uniref:hypothetical protein n=1 Tax=Brevundimonas sp. TaxID=1871086 RepID=UPI0025C2D57A|nr:hypothetical protein [Brevundimonas sp.]